jgi:hypothetical protein
MPSSPFLPKLAVEEPTVGLRYDPELSDLLESYLEKRDAKGYSRYHVSFRDYLFSVVEAAFPYYFDQNDNRYRGLSGHAVDYLSGRVHWQLGFAKRRPPRGWKEGKGIRNLAYPGISVYPALDEIGRRVTDFYAKLSLFLDDGRAEGDFVEGWPSSARLYEALVLLRKSMLPQDRLRLSAIAA